MHKKILLKKKKGMGLIYVIFAFLLLTIIMTSVLSIFSGNLLQAKNQEKCTQSYYIALSGIDLYTAAILQERDDGSTILSKYFSKDAMPVISPASTLEDSVDLEKGIARVTISAFDDDGERWIKILSTGTLADGSQSKTISVSFPVDNTDNRFWDRN